jgi:hypothetical protein
MASFLVTQRDRQELRKLMAQRHCLTGTGCGIAFADISF